jgi:Domain of unknown function (DUF4185)
MSISLIRAQNPQAVVTDGYILSLKAKDLDELIGDQVRAVRELEATWKGKAANAARARAYRDIQRQHRLHEILAAMASAMQSGAAALVQIRQTLLAWVESVSATFDVSDAGVVTPRPPNDTAPWVAIAVTFTKLIQQLIEAFFTADRQLAANLNSIAAGHVPGNDPVPGPGMVDPDSLNNPQLQWQQGLAGAGDPFDGEGGAGVPNTDLSIMGMTPEGRLFTIQGDTSAGVKYDEYGNPVGGPVGKRLPDAEGGRNNIIFWKMDEHGKWVPEEVVNGPFHTDGESTIPTSTFNVGDTMYTSVMDVNNWRDNTWQTNSSQLWKSTDGGRTWSKVESAVWQNSAAPNNNHPFQVQSFAPNDDGYVYMYGTSDGRENDGLHVARVPVGAVEDPSQYQYWTGNSFEADQNPLTSPAVVGQPLSATGVGEPSVHFYDNKALLTFTDDAGLIYTSSSVDGVTWTTPQLVADQPGAYGAFQSPLSGGESVDISLSQWNPYGTNIYQIQNSDTRGLGAYGCHAQVN